MLNFGSRIGVIQKIFLVSGSTKKCDHDYDRALKKKHLGICIEYTYISELMLWLRRGKFVQLLKLLSM